MSKRGVTRPWKVIGQWPGGRPFVTPYITEAQARDAARRQAARINPNTGDTDCVVTVEYRAAR